MAQPVSINVPLVFFCLQDSKKNYLPALLVTSLVIGLLGTLYFACGLTPLVHTWKILTPLASLSSTWSGILILTWSSVGVFSAILLIIVHKNNQQSFASPQVVEAMDKLSESSPEDNSSIEKIKKFINKGCSNYLEYYDFYYQLSVISEHVRDQAEKKEVWKAFLIQVDGTHLVRHDRKSAAVIDCSMELDRLGNKIPQLIIGELKKDSCEVEKDLQAINLICSDAFPNWGKTHPVTNTYLRAYFFKKNNRVFVIRSDLTQAPIGVICLSEENENLYIHTLARRASAVKWGVTQALEKYFKQELELTRYKKIWCFVLKNNTPAQYIYKKLGFKTTMTFHDSYAMEYTNKPSS